MRFSHLLHPEQRIGVFLQTLTSQVDFDAWYQETSSPIYGMAPAARLEWPADVKQRVVLQAELIRQIADQKIDLEQFLATFFMAGRDDASVLSALVNQLFLPFTRDLKRLARPVLEEELAAAKARTNSEESKPLPYHFIDKQRLAQLESIQANQFDLRKLIQLCRELDFCFRNECLLTVAALTRALLDHVPPLFGMQNFGDVVNNYAGTKSFRASMQHLEKSARNIGNAHLHVQIRKRESLPTPTQVNFSNDIDVLLGEIVRILGIP